MSRTPRLGWSMLPAAIGVLVQLGVLYAPTTGGVAPFANFDKLVHMTVFLVPVMFALLARLPIVPVVTVMALHAPVSEVVQATLLPHRSGDPWDTVADLTGVLLGVLVARSVIGVRDPGREAGLRRGR